MFGHAHRSCLKVKFVMILSKKWEAIEESQNATTAILFLKMFEVQVTNAFYAPLPNAAYNPATLQPFNPATSYHHPIP
jgi:hypothetical protein